MISEAMHTLDDKVMDNVVVTFGSLGAEPAGKAVVWMAAAPVEIRAAIVITFLLVVRVMGSMAVKHYRAERQAHKAHDAKRAAERDAIERAREGRPIRPKRRTSA